MIISCPNCNAGFFVSPAQIGATGRRVKCSKCKNVWHATVPHDAIPKEDILAQRLVQNVVTGANLPAVIPIKIGYFLYSAPPAFLMMILLTIWILYPSFGREIGICGSMCIENGVRIEDISYDFEKISNKVIVEYSIANRTKSRTKVPLVRLNLTDNENITLRSVKAEGKGLILEPNTSVRAKTEFNSISPNSRFVNISLGSTIKFWFR
jgi:predicted Zn finger-like uncharacterized protein